MAEQTTHTGPAVQKVVSAVQEDLGEIVAHLERALEKIRAVEVDGKGINGLAAILKAKGNELEQTIEVLQGEAQSVAKKMLSEPKREPITQTVDHEQVAKVAAARAGA